jgi:hypothetical protein
LTPDCSCIVGKQEVEGRRRAKWSNFLFARKLA